MGSKDRKKIFFVLSSMEGGGAEKVASTLLRHLNRNRYEVELVLFKKTGEFLSSVPSDVKIIDLKKKNRFSFINLIIKFRRYIKEQKPDLLISSLYYSNIITVLSCILLPTNSKIILCEHISHKKSLPHKNFPRLVGKLINYTYRKTQKIITVSNNIRKDLLSDFKISPDRIQVIHNPMEIEEIKKLSDDEVSHPFFEFNNNAFVIIGVGRLVLQKNFKIMLRTLASVRKKIPAYLLILGHGELESDLKDLVGQLGLNGFVDFVGFQHNPYSWIKRADAFVLTSRWEGCPLVVVESMICGTPIISFDWSEGSNELITDYKNGRIVPMNAVSGLSEAIIEVVENEELRNQLVNEGFKSSERFHYSKIVQQYSNVFEEVLI